VFERFTERARQVVVLAQDESRALRHDYIGTEHILLGLLREEEGLAARVLESLDIAVEDVRAMVARVVGQGDEVTTGQIPFTPQAKSALELSLREALSLGHDHIGTEHVLLGLVGERDGVAARILDSFGAEAGIVRDEVLRALAGGTLSKRTPERRPVVLDGVDEWQETPTGPRDSWVSETRESRPLLPSLGLAAAAFPAGLLVGWLIWG
jgi:ATP-dependent Clp protease ATP-binding subunit ClpA